MWAEGDEELGRSGCEGSRLSGLVSSCSEMTRGNWRDNGLVEKL